MGTVYEAEQVSLSRRVAVKVLSNALAADSDSVQRFRREVEAVAKLNHPGIVAVYCVDEDRGVNYYAMELVDGPPLSDIIRDTKRRLTSDVLPDAPTHIQREELPTLIVAQQDSADDEPAEAPGEAEPATASPPSAPSGAPAEDFPERAYARGACEIVAQAAEALDHAHRQSVVHRDIKPQNIMIARTTAQPEDEKGHSAEGQVKITDFGLARFQGDLSLTAEGALVGS